MRETDALTIKLLEEQLQLKEKNYRDTFQELNEESNGEKKNQLEQRRQRIYQDMKNTEKEIEQIKQSMIAPHPLLAILAPFTKTASTSINRAYQACVPKYFSKPIDDLNLEIILSSLQNIRGDNLQFTPIEYFVAHLIADVNVPQLLCEQLQVWGRGNNKEFDKLLKETKQIFCERHQPSRSYLLVKIKPLEQKSKSDRYHVSAWLIPDIENYQPENPKSYESLYVSDSLDDNFTIDDIPNLVNSFFKQIKNSKYKINNLTLEFFLPVKLIIHPIDKWIQEEFNYPESIGKKYRLAVRAYERLDKTYRSMYEVRWREKWQQIKPNCRCSERFVLSHNHNLETLRKSLDKAVGLMIYNFPESTNSSIFSLLLITATPIAICIRPEMKTLESQHRELIDSFSTCCILELPESVKEKRLDALQNQEDHIGHHLSLVWEDPERLTPDAEQFYSIP